MKLNFTGATDPGLIRSHNQDAYYIDPDGRFFIVADGMGGHAGGEEASRIAIQEIQAYLTNQWDFPENTQSLLRLAISQANNSILQDQVSHPERSDMGTTVVVVVFRSPEPPMCAHLGDSRLYHFTNSQVHQITQDHTWVAKAIKTGEIGPEEARSHPYRHVLSRCLGRADLSDPEVQSFELNPGDRLLLCSDGLTEELLDEQIFQLYQNPDLEQTASSLVEAAKANGGKDNITVILISAAHQD
ncbi:Stp1/IreP family PP2C-type Ser/Thr phosphatase [Cylindrospermopsis curvispora]|uniref:Stp1/IreP family PP2C-type Ser/Thr phosphatase n=1 Tax=Cylindrospermopsis curvispora GIHE-G1 TaxID=2666332 RepID=A0A7H0F0B2_9CYAN|nr:Stp1/IreP family PP2C-type Ser/Thr phosphatase [Cylindrospermopsis curvispora]QNP29478.1 Stp1/IreP family PP2C-type Ser/Thr phosphatase [Cylindrospermopsis curvispora GIHE-G1]